MVSNTDRIEKRIILRAPIARVWSAISDARQFGTWFGVEFEGPFVVGKRISGKIVPTKVDDEVARMQEPFTGMACDIIVQRIEPTRLFSFKWHPNAVEPGVDFEKEAMTLVTFELEEVAGATRLTITESGFDAVPLERRAEAFTQNSEGWAAQTKLIEKYLARTS